ncbi:MAG TPA: hypothetical protein VF654_04485 [Pyrinomonadaceae bacterium]|jgi:hypothetical protein
MGRVGEKNVGASHGGQPGRDGGQGQAAEVKKGVLDGAQLTSGARLRVGGGFRGYYRDAQFGDDGVSVGAVSAETEAALRSQFPNAEIAAVEG